LIADDKKKLMKRERYTFEQRIEIVKIHCKNEKLWKFRGNDS